MSKPSLHDIAAMPFPASMHAMRKYYDPSWAMACGGAGPRFRVTIFYTVPSQETEVFEVEAGSTDQAKAIAREIFDRVGPYDADVDDVDVEPLDDADEAAA